MKWLAAVVHWWYSLVAGGARGACRRVAGSGQACAGFQSADQHGKQHTLRDYRGKWLVLYFYPKDDTPGCTKEACAFRMT